MLSNERFVQITANMTVQALKVYGAVPRIDRWSTNQVLSELRRNDVMMAPDAVAGCLDSLVRAGIVRENSAGFQCVPVKKPAAKKKDLSDLKDALQEQKPQEDTVTQITATSLTFTPLPPGTLPSRADAVPDLSEILDKLAQDLQATARRHQEEMATLANLVADMAVDVQAERELHQADITQMCSQHEKELGKFAQLKALLKGISE